MERRTIHFIGRVQGVGFRYTAQTVARDYDVSGYVRNLDDGRVEMVVEGAAGDIDRLVESIRQRMAGFVRNVESHASPATGEFDSFTIRH